MKAAYDDGFVFENELAEIGDEVSIYNGPSSWYLDAVSGSHRGRSKQTDNFLPTGTKGEIVGFDFLAFGHLQDPLSRWERRPPGLYRNAAMSIIRFAGGIIQHLDARQIRCRTAGERAKAQGFRERWLLGPRITLPKERVADLPQTLFYAGDVVMISMMTYHKGLRSLYKNNEDASKRPPPHLNKLRVMDATFSSSEHLSGFARHEVVDGSYQQVRGVCLCNIQPEGRWDTYGCLVEGPVAETHLDLKERGPVWKRLHNEPATFDTLVEEVNFSMLYGEYEALTPMPHCEVGTGYRSPVEYPLSFEEALIRIKKGEGHGMMCAVDENDKAAVEHAVLIRFPNEDLGQRVRRATLEDRFFVWKAPYEPTPSPPPCPGPSPEP